jgi:hypothetical protein
VLLLERGYYHHGFNNTRAFCTLGPKTTFAAQHTGANGASAQAEPRDAQCTVRSHHGQNGGSERYSTEVTTGMSIEILTKILRAFHD